MGVAESLAGSVVLWVVGFLRWWRALDLHSRPALWSGAQSAMQSATARIPQITTLAGRSGSGFGTTAQLVKLTGPG